MSVILARKQPGSLTFAFKNNWSPAGVQVAEATILCAVNLGLTNQNEEGRTAFERIQGIVQNATEVVSDFTVTMELIDGTQQTQRLEGFLSGAFFRKLSEGLGVDPFLLKLEIGLVCPAGLRKTLVLQEMSYLNNAEALQENVAFRFTQALDPCWVPSPDFVYNYELTAELLQQGDQRVGFHMPQSLAQMNRNLLEESVNADFGLILEDGTGVPCHKLFLHSCSEAFATLIQAGAKEEPPQNAIKLGRNSTKAGVTALLKYIYYRDLTDPSGNPQIAFELLALSHCYQISNLERAMKELLLQKKEEWWRQDFKAEVVAKLFMTGSDWGEHYEQLVERAIQILQSKYSRSKEV